MVWNPPFLPLQSKLQGQVMSSVSPALGMSEAGLHVARHQVQLGKVSDCASHRHVNMDSKGIKDI
jgi:hypothetical protein